MGSHDFLEPKGNLANWALSNAEHLPFRKKHKNDKQAGHVGTCLRNSERKERLQWLPQAWSMWEQSWPSLQRLSDQPGTHGTILSQKPTEQNTTNKRSEWRPRVEWLKIYTCKTSYLTNSLLVKNNTRSSPFFKPIKMDERFVQVLQQNTQRHTPICIPTGTQ